MSEAKSSKEILIVAAEASSELYAGRIIDECRRRKLNVHFFGIGSRKMAEVGCEVVEYSENMAVVGLWEVLARWKVISHAFKKLLEISKIKKPKLALLLDYPDFNLRLAKKLYNMQIPIFYYISPQVWAWRTGRVKLIKRIIRKMLVVFPFEVAFYQSYNIDVKFVGHPLLDEIANSQLSANLRIEGRQRLNVQNDDFLVGLMPGSRESEIENNFVTQMNAAAIISKKIPNAKFMILVAPTLDIELIKTFIPPNAQINYVLVKDEPLKMIQLCDSCIVASGTATLMAALAETPMVIMYKMNALTAIIAKRLVKGNFFGMPNLIFGEQVVPELFQQEASDLNLACETLKFIEDKKYLENTKHKLSQIKYKLGSSGANLKVVDEIQKFILSEEGS